MRKSDTHRYQLGHGFQEELGDQRPCQQFEAHDHLPSSTILPKEGVQYFFAKFFCLTLSIIGLKGERTSKRDASTTGMRSQVR